MKLKKGGDAGSGLSDLRKLQTGPAHLAGLIRLLDADLERLPLDIDPPAAVAEAYAAYAGAVAFANQRVAELEVAEEQVRQAGAHDVSATVAAFSAGKSQPKQTQTKAAEQVTAALVSIEAAEQIVTAAHDALVDAVTAAWPVWRRGLIAAGKDAHKTLVIAAEELAASTTAARELYAAVGALDVQMLAYDPALSKLVLAERRGLLEWYNAAHRAPVPLGQLSLQSPRRSSEWIGFDLQVVTDAILASVTIDTELEVAEWVPPSDPEHDKLRATPLDLEAYWVVSQVWRECGGTCALCHLPNPDIIIEKEGQLWPAHAACRERLRDPREVAEAERVAKMQSEGYPEDPQAGRWKVERDAARGADALAAARGGGDSDANATKIAKRQHSDDA